MNAFDMGNLERLKANLVLVLGPVRRDRKPLYYPFGPKVDRAARHLAKAIAEWEAQEEADRSAPYPLGPKGECVGHDRGGPHRCCDRAGEYNGFDSGPLLFTCPEDCSCHD